jgi:hypothetical protein
MGLDIDQAGGVHLLELRPGEGIRGIRDSGWIDEQSGWDVALFDDGIEHGIDRKVAVVDDDCDGWSGRGLRFAKDDVGNAGEGKNCVVTIARKVSRDSNVAVVTVVEAEVVRSKRG